MTPKKTKILLASAAALGLFLAALCFTGCSTPSPYLFTPVTNLVSQIVVPRTNTVTVTNVLTEVITKTNYLGLLQDGSPKYEIVVSPVERFVVSDVTKVIFETNQLFNVTYQVSTNAAGLAKAAGSITNIIAPGVGDLVTKGLLGVAAIFGGLFARRYKKEGETIVAEKQDALEKTAGGLAQVIQTYREVARSTPQGAIVDEKLKAWMQGHQRELGIIDITAEAVQGLNHEGARRLAATVQEEAARLLGTQRTQS